jgi:hypothetical protein
MWHHDVDLLAYRDLDGRSGEWRSTSAYETRHSWRLTCLEAARRSLSVVRSV